MAGGLRLLAAQGLEHRIDLLVGQEANEQIRSFRMVSEQIPDVRAVGAAAGTRLATLVSTKKRLQDAAEGVGFLGAYNVHRQQAGERAESLEALLL
jgi:hypothetical protein